MMEYYPLKNLSSILPPLAPIPFCSPSITKLLEKLFLSPVTDFSPPILSVHFSPHSLKVVLVKVVSDFPFALLMTNP